MRCKYCFYEIQGDRHESLCPYNPINTKKILIYLKNYVITNSKFNKQFKPFPKPRELDEFCRKNKIARLQTITHRYLSPGERINDWLVELLDYGLNNNILGHNEFPYFLQFLYDSWIFKSREEYQKLYEESIVYEDGDAITEEVTGWQAAQRAGLLRDVAVPFCKGKLEVDKLFFSVIE